MTLQRLFEQNGLWITTPFNQGTASVRGLEADLKLPIRTWFARAPELDLRANLARNWSSLNAVPGPGNRLDSQVPVTLNLGADYRYTSQLSGGASFNLQTGGLSRREDRSGSYTGVRRTVDAYALWQPQNGLRLRLSLLNLLHQPRVQGQWYRAAQGSSDSFVNTAGGTSVRLLVEHSL